MYVGTYTCTSAQVRRAYQHANIDFKLKSIEERDGCVGRIRG